MTLNVMNPNLDCLKDRELLGVKRRILANAEMDGVKIKELDNSDSKQEINNFQSFYSMNKQIFDSMNAVEIINHVISKPSVPLKYKHTNEMMEMSLKNATTQQAKRKFLSTQGFGNDLDSSNFTSLAIRNKHIYKLTNSSCSCPLQGLNYRHSDDVVNQVSDPIKILCPIHSGHPIHESIRISRKNIKSLFSNNQDNSILQDPKNEKIIVVKEFALACKYRMISYRRIHILYMLSLIGSTNQVSMFQLSSPLQTLGYVVLKDLHLQQCMLNSGFNSSSFNGPALFIATNDEFRIAALPDSLGNTKVVNQKYISRMHIIIRQRNYGVSVSKILCHETSGRIFILDESNNVYEFVYQYMPPSYSNLSFNFLKPLKTMWNSFCSIAQYLNSLLNMHGEVAKYTVNPVEIKMSNEEEISMKPLNCSCLNDRVDISVKSSILYYPAILWEAVTPDTIPRLQSPTVKNVCNCGAASPCISVPIKYRLKSLNPWYLSRSLRSNSTIVDGFVDPVKNILAVLFLNGDVIIYILSGDRSDDLLNGGNLSERGFDVRGYILRGDQIQQYLLRKNYYRHLNSMYIGMNRDFKKYHTISAGCKDDELVANCENVVAVLSDEFGTRIYIGFSGGYTTAPDGSLVKVTNETGNLSYAKTNPVLVVKGYRLLPPHFSPEGFAPENADHRLSGLLSMHKSVHKTFRLDSNEFAIVEVAYRNFAPKATSPVGFVPPAPFTPFSTSIPRPETPRFSASYSANTPGLTNYSPLPGYPSGPGRINPLTAGPAIGVVNTGSMYKITIVLEDKDTYSEISNDHQGLSRTIWNSLNNISGLKINTGAVHQVEWYDQFHLYLSQEERLVSIFLNKNFENESFGRLIIITTFHVYNIEHQSLYTLMEKAINNPITALEAYDEKAIHYFPKWLESSQNMSKLPKFSNLMDMNTMDKEVDILDIAANKKYVNKDASEQMKISETQCAGFLFYLFAWMYSPQVFFSVVWKLLVNSNAINFTNVNLKHYCSSLIFPEYTNDVRLSLMCNSMGIYSKQYNWSVFTMEDKIYPWPKMLTFGSLTYFRAAKIRTKAISPIVEGLLLYISELFSNFWFIKLFPHFIKYFSKVAYMSARIGTTESQTNKERLNNNFIKCELVKALKDHFSLQPNYKIICDQLESLANLLKISIVCNSRVTFKESICDALAKQMLNDFACDWQNLITTDIRFHRYKLMKCVKSPSDELFGSNVLTRTKEDVDQEYVKLKSELMERFDRDISLLNECSVLVERAKNYFWGAIVFQRCILDGPSVDKFITVFEAAQKMAKIDFAELTLEMVCRDNIAEKEFLNLVMKVKKAFNVK